MAINIGLSEQQITIVVRSKRETEAAYIGRSSTAKRCHSQRKSIKDNRPDRMEI